MLALPLVVTLIAAAAPAHPPTAAQARAFVARMNDDLRRVYVRQSLSDWVNKTYLTDDTEELSAIAGEEVMAYLAGAIPRALPFARAKGIDPETARALQLLRVSLTIPPPRDPRRRAELAALATRLEGIYGKGKWCGDDGQAPCRDLEALTETMRTSRDPAVLLDAWRGWHRVGREVRDGGYPRLVELMNEGAREIGFHDAGELWRAGYDMTPAQFAAETDRLWNQVKPLYDALHCHVRARLQDRYGKALVPDGQPIPAHLLGNMWAQEWGNVFDLVAPAGQGKTLDVDGALVAKGYDAVKMVKVGEGFYTSLGLDPLPATFWTRSMFTKPRDREVVCHASAWDVHYADDLRVKMCIRPTADDLSTIHHELGHDYYFQSYYRLPVIFQQGANDGFHEAIGDAIALSVTPGYLKQIGILDAVPPEDPQGVVAAQLRTALDKIAFLPFGLLVDRWRWEVFAGEVKPPEYTKAWWDLRREYEGVAPPVSREAAEFDPGAKYHVAASVPYTRYFLAAIYQFQFHRALCHAAGHQGPLHTCSIYGSKEAGKRLRAMLAMGASRPWPDAMEALTGQRQADASALLEYFAPLKRWLDEQNRGRQCGW